MSLKKVLSSLEAAMRKKYPSRLADLQKPATKKSLTTLQKAVGCSLPDEVLELYRWRGGAEGFLTLNDTDEFEDGWDWCSAGRVLQEYRLWSKRKPKAWQSGWLPLFSNGAGDSICLDAESGRLLALFHEDADGCEEVAESLEEALKVVLARVKSGTWRGAPESRQVRTWHPSTVSSPPP